MELLANILDARGKSHANSLPVTGRCDRDGSIVEFSATRHSRPDQQPLNVQFLPQRSRKRACARSGPVGGLVPHPDGRLPDGPHLASARPRYAHSHAKDAQFVNDPHRGERLARVRTASPRRRPCDKIHRQRKIWPSRPVPRRALAGTAAPAAASPERPDRAPGIPIRG